ncbi:MAG: trypsin-like peptidase domain-containing protein [Planctomycetota bacterium]
MAITIRRVGGESAGEVLEFDDSVAEICFGRDPDRCQVTFPAKNARVSREHFAIRRVLGSYRLVLNKKNPVLVDGKPAHDDQVLGVESQIQVGRNGPVLLVMPDQEELDIHPTIGGGDGQPGVHTMWQRTSSSLRWYRLAIGAIAVLVVTFGFIAWQKFLTTEELLVSLASTKIDRVEAKEFEDELNERIRGAGSPGFQEIFEKAQPSVCIALVTDAKLNPRFALGTSWVVDRDRGLLATNAHVAESFRKLGDDERFVVRPSGVGTRALIIEKVWMHPGYGRFEGLSQRYFVVEPRWNGQVSSVVTGCDVALLEVRKSDRKLLGPPLRLASDEALLALRAGDEVAYVGFPTERMTGGGTNLVNVSSTCQAGRITSMTNYFMASTSPAERRLVQHNLAATGGSSGSPIFNQAGEVVAIVSAGNIFFSEEVRFPLAVGVNFGQRADVLRELLEIQGEELEQKAEARTRSWEKEFVLIHERHSVEIEEMVIGLFKKILEGNRIKSSKVSLIAKKSGEVAGGSKVTAIEFVLPADGQYLVLAIANSRQDINLTALRHRKAVRRNRATDHFPWFRLSGSKGDVYKLCVGTRTGLSAKKKNRGAKTAGAGGQSDAETPTKFELKIFRAMP